MANGEERRVNWIVHIGAVLLVGWKNEDGGLDTKTFNSSLLEFSEGDRVTIESGEIVKIEKGATV